MRVIIIVSICLSLLIPVTGQQHVHKLNAPLDQVRVSGNIHLRLVPSSSTYLEFETEEFPESLILEQDKNKLTLRTKTELKQTPALEIRLYHPQLNGIESSRGAIVHSSDTLQYKTLNVLAETGGKAEITVSTDSLSARVGQGSDIILYGKTRSLQVNANTMGNCLAYEFQAVNAYIKATTGSQVKVNVKQLLQANASGGAFVGYMGEPAETDFSTSVGGKINPESE